MDPGRAAASTRGDGASPPPPVFPAGLRVLLVDDDATCLKIVAQMLRKCLYDVTTCSQAKVALDLLRRTKERFDLVLSDVYMPYMDGFKLLEYIGLEMDLPVIMMSADDHKDVVMKGVTHGACDYIIKPVRMESLRNIWQHVVRKKNEWKELESSGSLEESDKNKRTYADEGDNASSASGGNGKSEKRQRERKDEEDEEEVLDEHDDPSHSKKPRVVWSAELHQKFLTAVNQLGVDKAVPKKILELMNVAGLTRENVASHLQKYRLYLRRVSVPQNQGIFDAHYTSNHEATYNSIGSVDGFNLQGLGVSAPLPPQGLAAINSGQRIATSSGMVLTVVDQLGFISSGMQVTGASNIVSSSLQEMDNQRMSNLHGRSRNIELSQLGQSQQVVQPHGSINLQFGEGTSSFLILPSLASTTFSSPGGTISRQPNKPLNMHMTEHNHGQQFSEFQQSSMPYISLPGQPQLRGQLLDEVASHNPRLVSTLTQQTPPNDIANHLVGRLGTNANTLTSLPSNYINAPYGSASPQTLYFDGQTNFTNRSAGSSYPPVSVTAGTPQVRSYDPFTNSSSLKGINHHVSRFDTIGEHQNGSQDWKLQKVNISYQSGQTLGLEQNDCHASQIGHRNAVATTDNRENINSGTPTEEILSVPNKIDDKTSIARHNNIYLVENSAVVNYEGTPDICYQNLFLGDNFITNELMNVVQEQRQGGIGQADAEFNIPV